SWLDRRFQAAQWSTVSQSARSGDWLRVRYAPARFELQVHFAGGLVPALRSNAPVGTVIREKHHSVVAPGPSLMFRGDLPQCRNRAPARRFHRAGQLEARPREPSNLPPPTFGLRRGVAPPERLNI